MKSDSSVHTTNYYNTFIEVAEDYLAQEAKIPLAKGEQKTIAQMQYEMLKDHPYRFTSDDVLFQVYARRKEIPEEEYEEAREIFFSKGQACFRASPLTKSHGFGVHSDDRGRIALYPLESEEYKRFLADPDIRKFKAMRTSKNK